MIPGLLYRIDFQNFDADFVRVEIADTTVQIDDDATPQVIQLMGTGDPLHIKVIDNDEDKFSPVRAKQAVIQFVSSPSYNISTFADGSDNRFTVTVTLNPTTTAKTVFLGFLVLSDLQQTFQPDPQTVQLTASDHLGLLKDIPLASLDGDFMRGKYRIMDFIAAALNGTGMALPIKAMNNIKPGSGVLVQGATFTNTPIPQILTNLTNFFYPGQNLTISGTGSNNGDFVVGDVGQTIVTIVARLSGNFVPEVAGSVTFTDTNTDSHFYDLIRLDGLTFEQSVGVAINAYEALTVILTDDCFLTQYNGAWWICRIDEYDENGMYVAEFSATGEYLSIAEVTDLPRSVGAAETYRAALADMLLRIDRPLGFIKETYTYENPAEIICNVDLARGTGGSPTAAATETIDFVPDCLQFLREGTPSDNTHLDQAPFTGAIGLLRKRYESSYEKERYLLTETAGGYRHYFKTEGFTVQARDRISFGVSYRFNTDLSTTSFSMVHIRITGVDGFFYDWHYDSPSGDNYWVKKTAGDAVFTENWTDDLTGLDTTEWRNISAESTDIPVAGVVNIRLFNGFAPPNEVWFNGLTISYSPLINGSYQTYRGQYHKVSTAQTGYIAKRENSVRMSDAPKPLIKGALLTPIRREMFTAAVVFVAPDAVVFPGDVVNSFRVGEQYFLDSPLNAGTYRVVSVTYHIIGNTTDVVFAEQTIVNETDNVTVYEPDYYLADHFYRGAPVALGPPASVTDINRFGYHQAFAVWNQTRNSVRKFSGSVLHFGELWPDIVHKFSLTDYNQNTNNRFFLLISFDQNWKSCLMTTTFVEVYNSVTGKDYGDNWEFKYIDQ